jgi:hypothetical protein
MPAERKGRRLGEDGGFPGHVRTQQEKGLGDQASLRLKEKDTNAAALAFCFGTAA